MAKKTASAKTLAKTAPPEAPPFNSHGRSGISFNFKNEKKVQCKNENSFGQIIKELRLKNNLTQEDVAIQMNITQANWSSYELGKSKPDLEMLILTASTFGISPFALIGATIDRARFDNSLCELSVEDYESISTGHIETIRKHKMKQKIEATVKQFDLV